MVSYTFPVINRILFFIEWAANPNKIFLSSRQAINYANEKNFGIRLFPLQTKTRLSVLLF